MDVPVLVVLIDLRYCVLHKYSFCATLMRVMHVHQLCDVNACHVYVHVRYSTYTSCMTLVRVMHVQQLLTR